MSNLSESTTDLRLTYELVHSERNIPQPVGPDMMMFLGYTSSYALFTLREREILDNQKGDEVSSNDYEGQYSQPSCPPLDR